MLLSSMSALKRRWLAAGGLAVWPTPRIAAQMTEKTRAAFTLRIIPHGAGVESCMTSEEELDSAEQNAYQRAADRLLYSTKPALECYSNAATPVRRFASDVRRLSVRWTVHHHGWSFFHFD